MPAKTPSPSPEIELRPWQVAGVRLMVSQPAAGLLMDPGLGKTLTTLAAFDILRRAGTVEQLLVVAPLRPAFQVWAPEVAKWGFPWETRVLHGAKKGHDLQPFLENRFEVAVINYEGLEWLFRSIGSRQLPKVMLVFDESSMLRNTSTKRFKLVRANLNRFRRRYILTGTPAPKGLENLFGQMYILDAGASLGQFVTHFRRRFMDQDPYAPFPKFTPKPGAADEIYRLIAPLTYRADDSLLDLPKKVTVTRTVQLPPKARLAYDDLERDLITQIDDKVVYAASAGVATGKLRQVADGGLYLKSGDQSSWKKMHDEKTEAVLELLEELEGKPTLVAYEFHHDLERLRATLGEDTPFIGGGVSPKRVAELERAWNQGDVPTMLVQPASVAFGLNLQAGGRALIWHSLTWNYEHYDQLIRRIYRQGQKHRVFVYHVVAKDTVDEAILEAMATRGANQKDLFDALKAYLKTRR